MHFFNRGKELSKMWANYVIYKKNAQRKQLPNTRKFAQSGHPDCGWPPIILEASTSASLMLGALPALIPNWKRILHRVTRLSDFYANLAIVNFVQFLNYRYYNFWATFSAVNIIINFETNWVGGYILNDFFTNSFVHRDSLSLCDHLLQIVNQPRHAVAFVDGLWIYKCNLFSGFGSIQEWKDVHSFGSPLANVPII
jgi:hypothetical protein